MHQGQVDRPVLIYLGSRQEIIFLVDFNLHKVANSEDKTRVCAGRN